MPAGLLERIPGKRDETAVVTLQARGPLRERIRQQGVPLYTLRMRRGLWSPLAAVRLARIINVFAPDIVHGWMYQGSFAASLASMMLARPVSLVWNIPEPAGGQESPPNRKPILARPIRWISVRPDAIVYNSPESAMYHRELGYAPDRSIVIPSGFDCSVYRPDRAARSQLCECFGIDSDALIVGVADGPSRQDGAMLAEALARTRAVGLDVHLLLLGDGREQPASALHELLRQNLPAGRITTAEQRPDIELWLPGVDVLASWPESTEPASAGDARGTVAKALASGVPVIATDVGENASLVGTCGAAVPPSDPRAFAAALVELGKMSPEERQKKAEAGRERVMGLYSLESVARRYHDLHRRLFDDTRYLGTRVLRRGGLAEGSQR